MSKQELEAQIAVISEELEILRKECMAKSLTATVSERFDPVVPIIMVPSEAPRKKSKKYIERSIKKLIAKPDKKSIEESIETPIEESSEKPIEEPIETPIEESSEAPIVESIEKPIEESTETPIEESTEKPIEGVKALVEESGEKSIEESRAERARDVYMPTIHKIFGTYVTLPIANIERNSNSRLTRLLSNVIEKTTDALSYKSISELILSFADFARDEHYPNQATEFVRLNEMLVSIQNKVSWIPLLCYIGRTKNIAAISLLGKCCLNGVYSFNKKDIEYIQSEENDSNIGVIIVRGFLAAIAHRYDEGFDNFQKVEKYLTKKLCTKFLAHTPCRASLQQSHLYTMAEDYGNAYTALHYWYNNYVGRVEDIFAINDDEKEKLAKMDIEKIYSKGGIDGSEIPLPPILKKIWLKAKADMNAQ